MIVQHHLLLLPYEDATYEPIGNPFQCRWVMSHTTRVSPVSHVPTRLIDQAKVWLDVAGVSRRLPRSALFR